MKSSKKRFEKFCSRFLESFFEILLEKFSVSMLARSFFVRGGRVLIKIQLEFTTAFK